MPLVELPCAFTYVQMRVYTCIRYHMRKIELTQWSRSVLFWLCLNSCAIETLLVTKCEILRIFRWPLFQFIPSELKLFGSVRLCFVVIVISHAPHSLSSLSTSLCVCVCLVYAFIQLNFDEYPWQSHLINCMENVLGALTTIYVHLFSKLARNCVQLQFLKTRKINIWKTKQIIKNGKKEKKTKKTKERRETCACVYDEKEKYLYIQYTYMKQQIQIDEQIRTSVFRNKNLYTAVYAVHVLGSNQMQIIIYKHEYYKYVVVCFRAKKRTFSVFICCLWWNPNRRISFKIQTLCKQTDFVWVWV